MPHHTLTGYVDTYAGKQAAERGGRTRLAPPHQSLHANADIDARHIKVTVSGGQARLTGTVRTWLQRNAIEHAVADAPGVTEVENCLLVEAPEVEPPDETC